MEKSSEYCVRIYEFIIVFYTFLFLLEFLYYLHLRVVKEAVERRFEAKGEEFAKCEREIEKLEKALSGLNPEALRAKEQDDKP